MINHQQRQTIVVTGTVLVCQEGGGAQDDLNNPAQTNQPVYPAEDVKRHQSLSNNMHGSLVFKEVLAPAPA